jgi:DNA-directed RNA polymerase subunit F
MENSWLESRREFFLRNMVQDFFEAAIYFDRFCSEYKLTGSVSYSTIDAWVGAELKKGSLWNLKDQCHRLFRNKEPSSNLYENLFDWCIGSIFHETIKLKEDVYQLETYQPLLELEVYRTDNNVASIIDEYRSVIENARSSLADELSRIKQLFKKALAHLTSIFPSYRSNMLLVRFLLDHDRLLAHKSFGRGYGKALITAMFPEGLHRAYLVAAAHCIANGRQQCAVRYLKKVTALAPDNAEARSLLRKITHT